MGYPAVARIFFGARGIVLFVWLFVLIIAVIMVNRDVMRSKLWMSVILGGICSFIATIYFVSLLWQIVLFVVVSGITYAITVYRDRL